MRIKAGPGWLSQLSVRFLVSAQVMISWHREFEPHVERLVDSGGPAWGSLSLPLPHLRCLSLSQNKEVNLKKNEALKIWDTESTTWLGLEKGR